MIDQTYAFSDDSKLLSDVLANFDYADSFLEIGVGGGAILLVASKMSGLCVGTDIRKLNDLSSQIRSVSEVVIADKASCFRESVFDLVVFNPPYVPSETITDPATDGGPHGVEIPLEFLTSALQVLKPGGKILMVLSSEDSLEIFERYCRDHQLVFYEAAQRRLFFETLSVFVVSRLRNRPED